MHTHLCKSYFVELCQHQNYTSILYRFLYRTAHYYRTIFHTQKHQLRYLASIRYLAAALPQRLFATPLLFFESFHKNSFEELYVSLTWPQISIFAQKPFHGFFLDIRIKQGCRRHCYIRLLDSKHFIIYSLLYHLLETALFSINSFLPILNDICIFSVLSL